jgi:hypothetical protein
MPTVSVNASREGTIAGPYLPVWFDARNDPTGANAINRTSPTVDTFAIASEYISSRAGDQYRVTRAYFYWNLSAYAGNITAIDMNIDLVGSGTPLAIQPAQSVLAFGGNGGSSLVTNEFDINIPTPPSPPAYSASPFTNNAGIVTTTLNPTAITDANNNGFLIIQLVEFDYDYPDNDPTPFGYQQYYAGINFAFGTNTLDVTYTAGYANQVNNVDGADIGEVIGVAGGSIGEIMNT